jgi:hypothetical protein
LISGVGSVVVVIAMSAAIVPLYDCDAVTPFASVAVMVNAYAPAAAAVPVIAPVEAFKVNPVGNDPAETENVTGAVPPDVCTV